MAPVFVPAAEPVPPVDQAAPEQTAGGLQVSMIVKERTFTFGDNKMTRKVLVLQMKNVSEKPLVLGFDAEGGDFGMAADSPIKLSAKDAAGKEVPRGGDAPRGGQGEEARPADRPAVLTVLKPGQLLEHNVRGGLRFPADGKYTVWGEIEVKEGPEVLPGVSCWSGKVKSNTVEYDFSGRRAGGGGRGQGQGQGRAPGQAPRAPAPAPIPGAEGDKEAF